MDGNKDEAQKCLRIGREALESGDRARAQKFISKARRLDPTLDVDDLLASFTADDKNPPSPDDSSSSAAAPSSSTQSGQPPPPSSGASANGSSSRTYTDDQVAVVRQIKKQKDYYEILGLEKGCSVEDVRKAYRKLSLKVHPDKNKAPGAEEAFKAVSKAFQCLSNEESRKKYDLLGTEEPTYDRPSARSHHYNGFYDADIDAEEIFRNFFFGMPQGGTPFGVYRFQTGRGPSHHGEAHSSGPFNFRILAQVLPVLILLVLNFLSSSDPIYSLQRSHPYILRVDTPKGVPYYVKSEAFHRDYPQQSAERLRLDDRIEREYFSILASNCRAELQRLQWGFSYQTPHCDMLKKFEAV